MSLLSLLAAGAMAQAAAPRVWYGPETASFHVQFTGNPYDPAENDIRVKFVDGKGRTIERLAYFDEKEGAWKATLVAEQPGPYRPILVRDGKESVETSAPQFVELKVKMPKGFLRVDPNQPNRFVWDSGQPYYPLGHNLPWQAPKSPPMAQQITTMAENGINWTRIWSDQWDGKNPWWPQDEPFAISGQLWPPALEKWEALQRECERSDIAYQMVLFNHGSFSTKTDANWPDHPWNEAKGGFLKSAGDFFTDPEAKRRTQMWLRYAVARYAHSSSLMAWELFNEVEWTDAMQSGHKKEVLDWHAEMAAYLRSIDPYEHMITTSSITDDAPWLSYMQPHTYPEDLTSSIQATRGPEKKPLFYGEFGPQKYTPEQERSVLRDGIYSSMLSPQSGVAAYWYWDRMSELGLYDEFKKASRVIELSHRPNHPKAEVHTLSVVGKQGASALALTDLGWTLARIRGGKGTVMITFQGLPAGDYQILTVDLETGEEAELNLKWEGIGHPARVPMPSEDVIVILKQPN